MKTMYDYKKPAVPVEAVDHIDKIHKARKEAGRKCRKADIWLEAVMKVKA